MVLVAEINIAYKILLFRFLCEMMYELYFKFQMKDKATVEMECMEDGFLAKIVRQEGEKEIQVGEVLILSSCSHFFFSLLLKMAFYAIAPQFEFTRIIFFFTLQTLFPYEKYLSL